jgi:nucleoid-associated protein YgaU
MGRTHVVHAGDSLESLAERYLGDEARALELFDLNRGVLENPHLLPIGAELTIPLSPEAAATAQAN